MKSLFGNSCAKGCMVYLVALVLVVMLSAAGAGSLASRFKLTLPGAGLLSSSGKATATPASAKANTDNSAQAPAPTPAPPVEVKPTPRPLIPAPLPPAAPTALPNSAPQVQAQGGEIKGQATAPFYIVQPGDTLSSISARFGVKVATLQEINKLTDANSIWTNQLLYLPQQGDAAPPPEATPTGLYDGP